MRFWPRDVAFFWLTFTLALLGLLILYSVSSVQGLDQYGDSMYFLRKQLVFAVLGFIGMLVIAQVSPQQNTRRGCARIGFNVFDVGRHYDPRFGICY